jgi:hypothetical protein
VSLLGRELEKKQLAELIDGVRHRGGALVVRGDAGIGKSALLAEVGALTATSRMRVLTTIGAESEEHLPYAGLHQLLHPVRSGIDALPAPQRDALRVALGLSDELAERSVPDGYLVGLSGGDRRRGGAHGCRFGAEEHVVRRTEADRRRRPEYRIRRSRPRHWSTGHSAARLAVRYP